MKPTLLVLGLFALLIAAALVNDSLRTVKEGHHGLQLRMGRIVNKDESLPPGLHVIRPITDEIIQINTEVRMHEFNNRTFEDETTFAILRHAQLKGADLHGQLAGVVTGSIAASGRRAFPLLAAQHSFPPHVKCLLDQVPGKVRIATFRVNEQRPIAWSRSGAFLYVEFAEATSERFLKNGERRSSKVE